MSQAFEISTKEFQEDLSTLISKPVMQDIYHVYDLISQSFREYLTKELDFLEFKPPLIGPVTDPGIRGSKQVEIDYYQRKYKFMSSGILYKQLLSISREISGRPGRIYFFADNLRLEPLETATTDRHLVEFIQVDLEIAGGDHFDAMEIAEGMLKKVYRSMKKELPLLQSIWREFETSLPLKGLTPRNTLEGPQGPFKKYTFTEAVDLIQEEIDGRPEVLKEIEKIFGIKPNKLSYDSELHWEYEWLLSSLHSEPFFIHDYPKGARGFYDREYPDKPGMLMDFDLLFPLGFGEAASGAAREYEIERIIPRMKETGESLQKYEWYLKFLKKNGRPTSGFGIGLERTVRYFCGLPSIALALPYPKIPGIYSP